jgi:hypothetical protein
LERCGIYFLKVFYRNSNRLTPWSRVVLEKVIIIAQRVEKFPTFYLS